MLAMQAEAQSGTTPSEDAAGQDLIARMDTMPRPGGVKVRGLQDVPDAAWDAFTTITMSSLAGAPGYA